MLRGYIKVTDYHAHRDPPASKNTKSSRHKASQARQLWRELPVQIPVWRQQALMTKQSSERGWAHLSVGQTWFTSHFIV